MTDIIQDARRIIGNRAFINYMENRSIIDQTKIEIDLNRKHHVKLSSISKDPDRLFKRIAREGFGVEVDKALERINGVPDFQDAVIIRKLANDLKSVCRICIRSGFGSSGYGTGFLIAPNILITNNHVLPDENTAETSIAQFNYEIDENGKTVNPVSFKLNPQKFFLTSAYESISDDPFSGLDFTLVAVESLSDDEKPLDQFGFIPLDGTLGKIIEGENCVVIQHPRGDYKKIVLKDIRMITLTRDFLIYESDTLPGSSGSVVIGLGTGEVVALHHSSVPKQDQNGNWLRKDGQIVQPGDSDDSIDWIGNEGIRVSRIIETIRNFPLPESMEAVRSQILTKTLKQSSVKNIPEDLQTINDSKQINVNQSGKMEKILNFEILLADNPSLMDDWDNRASELVSGFQSCDPLIPFSTDPYNRRIYYLTVCSDKNPWNVAAEIEENPHIEHCIPDLETYTDVGLMEQNRNPAIPFESDIFSAQEEPWDEDEFLRKWGNSVSVKKAKKADDIYHRWWNWFAVSYPPYQIHIDHQKWDKLVLDLPKIRIVQLDTGYSGHSKVFSGYDLSQDYDFVDTDEDAEDSMSKGILKQPAHGTRTASIVIGNKIVNDTLNHNGNSGLLTMNDQLLAKLIPYRIAKSVILIGRGKELTEAVKHAIRNNTDVMFMCMGSYPRPMIEAIAREAYYSGIIWVCAAGNEVEVVVAPAMYPGTVAVAAINPDDKPWKGSSNGKAVDIAAPGEDVYVPVIDNEGNESMRYGSGTSYATPHIAAAAVLWKAKNMDKLKAKYRYPWQIVEAFRYSVKKTARKPKNIKWNEHYGTGILDLPALLNIELPDTRHLKDAYSGFPRPEYKDPGIREAAHYIWNVVLRKIKPGSTERSTGIELTDRGKKALEAFTKPSGKAACESFMNDGRMAARLFLRDFFEQNVY